MPSLALVATDPATDAQTYTYGEWSDPIKAHTCTESISINSTTGLAGAISCTNGGGVKAYTFPAGIFQIDEQLLIPENTSITGVANPNDMANPTSTPNWATQTLFLATRGATNYSMNYCHAADMVTTRVGFVLSSHVTVRDVSYQGIDTIRPNDNGGLCGGAPFETKGCAENDCSASDVNNGGSDGMGSVGVTVENVRINDYYFAEDESKIGAHVEGNYGCNTTDWDSQCCFCLPNDVRSTQVGIWVPQSRNEVGTRNLFVNNIVSRSNQADAINLHGNVFDSVVQNAYFENTGDDHYVLWGAASNPSNITFRDSTAVNPGIMRKGWYGNCVATYGLDSVLFENIVCRAPTLEDPIPAPDDGSLRTDTSMFVFFSSFGAGYPAGNNVTIANWTFENLDGVAYSHESGVVGSVPVAGKMAWTRPDGQNSEPAPYYFPPPTDQPVNVYVSMAAHTKISVIVLAVAARLLG